MDTIPTTAISSEQMRLVLEVVRLLAATADLDMLLRRIAESATSLLCAERASIFLHDPQKNELWTKVALGAEEIRVPASTGIVGHAFCSNTLVAVPRAYEDARFNRDIDRRSGFVTRNLLTAPARDLSRQPIGVLQAVNRIGGDFTEGDCALIEVLADQAGVAIQRYYLQQEAVAAAGLRHEMDLAQRAMIPAVPPRVPGLTAAGWMLPASTTGGDCYDLWAMPDGRLGVFLGDASGHGIAPTIVVSQARTLVRSLAEIDCDPARLLARVNSRLIQDLELGRFVTIFLACVTGEGRIPWCSAGHGPIFVRTRPDAPVQLLDASVPPIGVVPEISGDAPEPLLLEPGGTLVVPTDGFFEARDPKGKMFELERVIAVLDRHRDRPAAQIITAMREAVQDWQQKPEPTDDQTMVVVQRDR
jgi:phosphoserine phosphatase RsbU/P